jgi:molybdopterin biosynthesis enzyme
MPASGHQDHTALPSASAPFVKEASTSIASRLTFMTISSVPLGEAGCILYIADLADGLSEIFFSEGLDKKRFGCRFQITSRCRYAPHAGAASLPLACIAPEAVIFAGEHAAFASMRQGGFNRRVPAMPVLRRGWLPSRRRVVHHAPMIPTQRLPASLTALDTALAAFTDRLEPVAAIALPLAEALGCVAAEMPPLAALPPNDIAVTDGWATRARDLVGASSYSPLALAKLPVWVEAGDAMPEGCDCVVDADLVDQTGSMAQVLGEAAPGQGVRRIGGDIAAGGSPVAAGKLIHPLDLMLARAAGLQNLDVRRPRLRVVNIPVASGDTTTMRLIEESARSAGADVVCSEAGGRDPEAITKALDGAACDLLLTVGGSGVGRSDAAVMALARSGKVLAHGIALQPGRTSGIGRIGKTSVIALPGAPDQALAGWWTLALPVVDRLAARQPRQTLSLPLKRKIASSVGVAEIVLLENNEGSWLPSAVGDLSLQAIARADAWLTVPGGREGFAAGTPVDAYMLRD